MANEKFYIVAADALPEVFLRWRRPGGCFR